MFPILAFLFVAIPILEVWVLLTVGGIIGPLPTIALILLTGAAGAALARREGLKALRRVQEALAAGRLPGPEIVSGVLVLVGGLLLLTPGLLTDAVGLLCLLPPTRELMAVVARRYLARHIQGAVSFGQPTVIDIDAQGPPNRPTGGDVLDVSGRELP